MKRFARYDPNGRNGGITLKQFLDIPEISSNPIMPKVASAHLDSRSRKITYRSFINMLSRLSPRNSLDDRKECEFLLWFLSVNQSFMLCLSNMKVVLISPLLYFPTSLYMDRQNLMSHYSQIQCICLFKVIPLFCTAHHLLHIILHHQRWR